QDWFSGAAPFTSSPVAFNSGGRDLVAVAARDGRLYVLDGKAPGGSDHKTPLATSAVYTSSNDFNAGAIATWQDAEGTRWLAVASSGPVASTATFPATNGAITNGTVAAFRLNPANGSFTLEPAWTSRDLTSPAPPLVLNDGLFARSTGAARGDAQLAAAQRLERSTAAVLYAL